MGLLGGRPVDVVPLLIGDGMLVLPVVFDLLLVGMVVYPVLFERGQLGASQKDCIGLVFEDMVGRSVVACFPPVFVSSIVHFNILFCPPVHGQPMTNVVILMSFHPAEFHLAWKTLDPFSAVQRGHSGCVWDLVILGW